MEPDASLKTPRARRMVWWWTMAIMPVTLIAVGVGIPLAMSAPWWSVPIALAWMAVIWVIVAMGSAQQGVWPGWRYPRPDDR